MDRLCRSTKLYTVEQKFYSLKPLRRGCYHQEAVYQSAFIKGFAELSFGIFWSTENQILYVYRAVAKKKAHKPLKKGHIVQFRPLWKSLLLKLVFITLHLANFIPLALLTNCAFLSFYSSRIKLCEQEPWVDNRDPKSTTQAASNAFPMYTNDWVGTATTLWKPHGCEGMGCVVLTSCKKRSK